MSDFEIKNGILKKVIENDTVVVIPDGVTYIKKGSILKKVENLSLPDSTNKIEDHALFNFKYLKKLKLPYGKQLITVKTFSHPYYEGTSTDIKDFPVGLIPEIKNLYTNMTDGALKGYVLIKEIWDTLDDDIKVDIFMSRQSKTLDQAYKECITEPKPFTDAVIKMLAENPDVKMCNTAASLMINFYTYMSDSELNKIYSMLNKAEKGKKAVERIEEVVGLKKRLGEKVEVDKSLSQIGQTVMELMIADDIGEKELGEAFKKAYAIPYSELPNIVASDKTALEPFVAAWIIMCKDKEKALSVISAIGEDEFQTYLLELSNKYLGYWYLNNQLYLAHPICRYADERTMEILTKKAPSWRSTMSGNDAPPLRTFRRAALESDTRAAMLFADRYHDLDDYAKLRNTTADAIRDTYLSDTGLDEDRCKEYDLGNQTVVARLQKDLSFIIELPDGKTAKSLPKKGADEDKCDIANKDFTEVKKTVKRILKNRFTVLMDDFLHDKKRTAEEWSTAYLKNPVLRDAAERVVWQQGKKTFIMADKKTVDYNGNEYKLTDKPVSIAHPMEMAPSDVSKWQKYITEHGIVQPFEQIWEPVIDVGSVTSDRYKGYEMRVNFFTGKDKHGIHAYGFVTDSEDYGFTLDDCNLKFSKKDKYDTLGYNPYDSDNRFVLGKFSYKKYNRQVNHIVGFIDRAIILQKIKNDDTSIIDILGSFTLPQITEFIDAAQKNNAANVTALLLEYKNKTYPDFDPMAEFTLDW